MTEKNGTGFLYLGPRNDFRKAGMRQNNVCTRRSKNPSVKRPGIVPLVVV